MAVSFPFYPEHVPLQSAFLSGSDHTSIVFEEVESSNDVLSNSDSPSTCDESIIELSLSPNLFDLPCVPQAVLKYQRGCGFYSESVYIGVFGPSQLVVC